MIVTLIILAAIGTGIQLFMRRPAFGSKAKGEGLARVKHSDNYLNGSFRNLHKTPNLKEGVSAATVMKDFFFNKSPFNKPSSVLPSKKTNLATLPANQNTFVWFGHSSYFLQVDGKRILVDPVFSGNASPLNFTTKSFEGSDVYDAGDMPGIDLLILTHDHWDHLDYRTLTHLQPKIKKIVTGLGVGAHLQTWGFDGAIILEKDWNQHEDLGGGFSISSTPARHFSGRSFKRNQTLWMSFVLQTPSLKIYIGGDTGYDTHFKTIGEQFGPFDIAILECGQYNEYWKYIHMMPEQVVDACGDLRASMFVPVHWSKFALSLHAWYEPIERVTAEAYKRNVAIVHALIGEAINLAQPPQQNEWWKHIKVVTQ